MRVRAESRVMAGGAYDAVVIGAGLTGAWSAREFAKAGLRVALVDAGALLPSTVFQIKVQANPASLARQLHRLKLLAKGEIRKALNPPVQQETQSFFLSEREHPYRTRGDNFAWSRVHAVGGRGHFWGRVLLRFTEEEFADHWPLPYSELANFYSEVEQVLQLGGAQSGIKTVPDGNYQTPRELSSYEKVFCAEVLKRWPERQAAVNHVAEYPAGPLSPMLAEALASGHVDLFPNSIALSVQPKGRRDVDVCVYDTLNKTKTTLRAAVCSVAASALETCRILLNSPSRQHARSLGDCHDLLGRSILEHLYVGAYATLPATRTDGGEYPFSPFWLNREPNGFYMPPVNEGTAHSLEDQFGIQGVISDRSGSLYVGAFGRMQPNCENRIALDDAKTDNAGRRLPTIHFRIGDHDRALFARMTSDLEEMIDVFHAAIGQRRKVPLSVRLKDLVSDKKIGVGSNHECGGAPMGFDPASSVTSPEGYLWDAENVLICDSACFPSLPPQNPTLTAMALAVRTTRAAIARL